MKLYGADISNYYNIVKQVALETGFEIEPVQKFPNVKDDYLPISPMGKIPAAETTEGKLAETRAILTYISNSVAAAPFFPASAWDRARVEELMSIADLYIESQARRHLAEVMFKGERDERAYKEVRTAVEKGMAALARRVALTPWVLGDEYTVADVYVFHCLYLARQLIQAVYDWDPLTAVDGLADWYARMAARDTTSSVLADNAAALKAMMG